MPIRRVYKSERFLKIIFGTSLFVVLCMGGLAYKQIQAVSRSVKMVEQTYDLKFELQHALSLLKDIEIAQKSYLLTQNTNDWDLYTTGRSALNQRISEIKSMIVDNPQQHENLKELSAKIEAWIALLETQVDTPEYSGTDEFTTAYKQGNQLMNSMKFKVTEMVNLENDLLKSRTDQSKQSLSNAPLIIYYVLILSLALLLLTYVQISKNLKNLQIKNEQLEIFRESTMQSEIEAKHGNWIWFPNDNSYKFSDNLYRLLGEEPQAFESTFENFMNFIHPEDVNLLKLAVDEMLENERLTEITYRIIQKNGDIRYFKAMANVLVDNDEDKKLLGTVVDITDEVEGLRLVEERNVELERKNSELESFNFVASHDLQEPLRKIQTFSSRLEDKDYDKLSDDGKLYVRRIRSASSRMRALIEDLLQFSRTNKSDELFEFSDMNSLLEVAQHNLIEIINEKNAKITSERLPSLKVIPFQMSQLFQNLISNSLKYSQEKVAPKIEISYSKVSKAMIPQLQTSKYNWYHTITLTDNGIGFDPEYASQIFVLFNRLHGKTEYSGTGIGLAICKKIVENHDGMISADGIPGKGAIFTIHLPI